MATLVSILVPIYNGIEYLEECINSVISQTFTNWELLIGINGHGYDGGLTAIIAKLVTAKDNRITVYVQPPPLKGKSESLNNLVEKTNKNTKWICIIDCDDKWEPTKLEKQIHISQSDASDASVIGTFCRYFGDRHQDLILPSGYISEDILESYNPIINSSSFIKKELCYWENKDLEDYSLWMDICLKGGKLYNIPEFLTWHRIHQTSAFNNTILSNDDLRQKYSYLLHHRA